MPLTRRHRSRARRLWLTNQPRPTNDDFDLDLASSTRPQFTRPHAMPLTSRSCHHGMSSVSMDAVTAMPIVQRPSRLAHAAVGRSRSSFTHDDVHDVRSRSAWACMLHTVAVIEPPVLSLPCQQLGNSKCKRQPHARAKTRHGEKPTCTHTIATCKDA